MICRARRLRVIKYWHQGHYPGTGAAERRTAAVGVALYGIVAMEVKGMSQNWLQQLSRSRKDRWIGGVCGGLVENSPLPSWAWRVFFCLLFFCFGTGLLLYLLLWIFMPKEPA